MDASIRFLGAARNVTGSNYLFKVGGMNLLIDCGMYQEREFADRNWEPFPYAPSAIDAVLLTHAHLDHCGLLPKLVRDGFKGKIYCTSATADIAQIVLSDSARIAVEDAAYKKRRHQKEGRKGPYPEAPLYTVEDAEATFPHFQRVDYEKAVSLAPNVSATFSDAGHILGSSMIKFEYGSGDAARSVIFSGDVGRCGTPILRDPTRFEDADYVVTESTYGDRLHGKQDDIPHELARVINETHKAGGNIVVPSFAVERTQEMLYHMNGLLNESRIPHLRTFVDSPMAIRVTEVFQRHLYLFDADAALLLQQGDHPCDFPGLSMTRRVDESKAIKHAPGTSLIIAGSGMCTGGRVKHHLRSNIERPESTILFIGYQARGTLGRIILEGADTVRIHGQEYDVAARVDRITGFSAHADRDELHWWISGLQRPPRRIFITHGEDEAADAYSRWLGEKTGWQTHVPQFEEEVALT